VQASDPPAPSPPALCVCPVSSIARVYGRRAHTDACFGLFGNLVNAGLRICSSSRRSANSDRGGAGYGTALTETLVSSCCSRWQIREGRSTLRSSRLTPAPVIREVAPGAHRPSFSARGRRVHLHGDPGSSWGHPDGGSPDHDEHHPRLVFPGVAVAGRERLSCGRSGERRLADEAERTTMQSAPVLGGSGLATICGVLFGPSARHTQIAGGFSDDAEVIFIARRLPWSRRCSRPSTR
jgi:hypothetical protein